MIDVGTTIIGFILMLTLMSLGVYVAVAIFMIAALGAVAFTGVSTLMSFGDVAWGVLNDFILTAIPLYILLGEILLRTGITERMYSALSDWLGRFPGGLLHTNIAASSMFAAVSGSSVATAATIGTVAIPPLTRRRYDQRLLLGSVAAGATLGILIPPSVNMIIYGAITNTSIGQLFIAGVIPGLMLGGMFMLVIAVACILRPSWAGDREATPPLRQRLRRLFDLLPPVSIAVVVMGSIYLGWATPTEAAAIGVLMGLALAAMHRRLTFAMLHEAFASMARVTGMILLIIVAAFYLNFIIALLGIPQAMTKFVTTIGATPQQTIIFLVFFYIILGCFLETLSMMIATVPVIVPVVSSLGYDPVWFGVLLVVLMEMALITPPIGINLYVVQSVRGRGPFQDVVLGTLPFLLAMAAALVLLIVYPQIALWLPAKM